MKLTEIFRPESVIPTLRSEFKDDVIRELVGCLVASGRLPEAQQDDVVAAILEREALGSTGIGRGVAIPHTKHESATGFAGALGLSADGVDFESLDGARVQIVFLLVSPADQPDLHLSLLKRIVSNLGKESFCRFLKQAKSAADVLQVLAEADGD